MLRSEAALVGVLLLALACGLVEGRAKRRNPELRKGYAMAESMDWWVIQQGTNWWAEFSKAQPSTEVKPGERRKEIKGRYADQQSAEAQAEKLATHFHGTFIKATGRR